MKVELSTIKKENTKYPNKTNEMKLRKSVVMNDFESMVNGKKYYKLNQ